MKVVSIVQARTGSTRLPGKVLLSLKGKTILEHVINRLKLAKEIHEIVIATTNKEGDNIIEYIANRLKVNCFRGSENDVLSRYLGAANLFKADVIVRITSDCPLIDPKIVDIIIKKHLREGNDYTYNNVEVSMFPRGFDVEVFSLSVLKKVSKLARTPYYREHVSKYIADHPQTFKVGILMAKGALRRPDIRLCVDTQADFRRLKYIYNKLGEIKDAESVIKLFDKPKIDFIGLASKKIGSGHIIRLLSIASILKGKIDCDIKFYINRSELLSKVKSNYKVSIIRSYKTKSQKIFQIKKLYSKKNGFVVCDFLGVTDLDLKRIGGKVLAIDTAYTTPERALMRKEFFPRKRILNKKIKTVLVSFGGSDPNNYTLRVLSALNMLSEKLTIFLVLGPMFNYTNQIKTYIKSSNHKIIICSNIDNIEKFILKSDIAIVSAGTTAYETSVLGTPSILIPQVEHQMINAKVLEKEKIALNLGMFKNVNEGKIINSIRKLSDIKLRSVMSKNGSNVVKNDSIRIVNDVIRSLIPET